LFLTQRWIGSRRLGVTQRLNQIRPSISQQSEQDKPGFQVFGLKKTTAPRKSAKILNGFPHMPFEEFPLKKSEDLVVELEKTMPEGAKVEVTPMEESHHSPCMQEMTAIMVHDIEEGKETSDIFTIYQFCPTCHIAVRVL
jgi:hypothetical protein